MDRFYKEHREKIAAGLSRLLADSYTLYLKTHNYHWNVTGPQFNTLHQMFEVQYTELATAVDEIAERIRQQIDSHNISLDNTTNLSVTISIGCTTLDNNKDNKLIAGEASQQLLMRADEALYRSKQRGRNQVNFFEFGT